MNRHHDAIAEDAKHEGDEDFALHEYDMDVVDEALADPDRNEYFDHFGFRIQVKTDDELSDDTSDDEGTDDELEEYIQQRGRVPAEAKDAGKSVGSSGSASHSSEEDDYSVDTTLTTPTAHPKLQRLSLSSTDQPSTQPAPMTPLRSPTSPLARHIDDSRPSFASAATNIGIPTSTTPITRSMSVNRPSQAYRERQNKRMSVIGTPHSVLTRTSTSSVSSKRLSTSTTLSTTTTYLERLKSKIMPTATHDADQIRESPQHIKLRHLTHTQLEKERAAHPGDYDWEFWKAVILDVDQVMSTELLAVRHHLSIGIPPALRGNMWQLIAKSQNQQTDMDSVYTELSKRTSLYEKSIQHDLENAKPITKCLDQFQLDPDATRPKMLRLLKAYSLFDPDIGYHQALAFLLITILHEIDDETAAFCLLVQLTGVYGLNGSLNQSTDTLEMLLYRLDHLLQMNLPELHRHMEATGLTPDVYASHWLTTCFAYGSPSAALTTHVMDLVLVQGTTVLDQFILALLKRNEQAMLTMGFEALVAFLQSEVFDVYNSQPNQWVIDMYQMDLSPKLYARLEKQYRVETMRRTRQRNDDEAVRQANDQLMSYLQEVQEKYRVLELEHQDVTRQAVETKLAMAKLDAENDDLRHQLSLMRHQFDDDQREAERIHDAKMQEANHSNEQLKKHCTSLENQITDLEAILISLKMKYAERENEYDYLRRELNEYKKNAQK